MNYDEVGTIYKVHPTFDEEGNMTDPGEVADGWHVNTLEPVPEWEPYKVSPQPKTPSRIYAGGVQPVCYVFPDKQAFRDLLPEEDGDVI